MPKRAKGNNPEPTERSGSVDASMRPFPSAKNSELVDLFASLFHDKDLATVVTRQAGIDRSEIPEFRNAHAFWHDVLNSVTKGGVDGRTLIREATRHFPGNVQLRAYNVDIERALAEPNVRFNEDEALEYVRGQASYRFAIRSRLRALFFYVGLMLICTVPILIALYAEFDELPFLSAISTLVVSIVVMAGLFALHIWTQKTLSSAEISLLAETSRTGTENTNRLKDDLRRDKRVLMQQIATIAILGAISAAVVPALSFSVAVNRRSSDSHGAADRNGLYDVATDDAPDHISSESTTGDSSDLLDEGFDESSDTLQEQWRLVEQLKSLVEVIERRRGVLVAHLGTLDEMHRTKSISDRDYLAKMSLAVLQLRYLEDLEHKSVINDAIAVPQSVPTEIRPIFKRLIRLAIETDSAEFMRYMEIEGDIHMAYVGLGRMPVARKDDVRKFAADSALSEGAVIIFLLVEEYIDSGECNTELASWLKSDAAMYSQVRQLIGEAICLGEPLERRGSESGLSPQSLNVPSLGPPSP